MQSHSHSRQSILSSYALKQALTQTLVLQMQGGEEKIFFQACKNKYFKIFFLELDIISLFFHVKNNTIIIRLWKQSALKLWAPTLLFAIITTV